MEHHPFLSFDDGLEITYSDIKERKSGSKYVTIYFEQPNENGKDFKSAQCNCPGGSFSHVVGYTKDEVNSLWDDVVNHTDLSKLLWKIENAKTLDEEAFCARFYNYILKVRQRKVITSGIY